MKYILKNVIQKNFRSQKEVWVALVQQDDKNKNQTRGQSKTISSQSSDFPESKATHNQLKPEELYCAFGGGVGHFGANFSIFSYQKTTIWIDIGAGFENQDYPGIQKILPNRYLAEIFPPDIVILTHGHEDHIGAFPFFTYLMPRKMCVITSPFTHALLKHRLTEQSINIRDFSFKIINQNEQYKFQEFTLFFFFMPHSIPQTFSVGLHIQSISKKIYFTSDFKLKGIEPRFNENNIKEFAPIDFLFCDSTGSLRSGNTPEESQVIKNLDRVIEAHKGRIFLTVFSSHIERVRSIFNIGQKYGRKLSVIGLSLKNYLRAAFLVNEFHIPLEQIDLPQNREESILCIISGCQADPNSSFHRLAHNKLNNLKVRKGDMLIYSASIIPGNEENVFRSLNNLSEMGVNIVGLNHDSLPLHVSGHGRKGDIVSLISLLKPNKVIPVHGDALHFYGFREFVDPSCLEIPTTNFIYSLNEGSLLRRFPLDIKMGFVEHGEVHHDLSLFHARKNLAQDGICNVIFDSHSFKVLSINYVGTCSGDFIDLKKADLLAEIVEKMKDIHLIKQDKILKKIREKIFNINQRHLRKRPYVNLIFV